MNALTTFSAATYVPTWINYVHTTLRIECDLTLNGIFIQQFEAEIAVYKDPTDYNQWHIGEMSIVGAERIEGTSRWAEKLIHIERHPYGGKTEEGYWAAAIGRAADAQADTIIEALEKEKHS